jgi:ABC-type branched-subunit amino acid transport system substrate-binding protein
MGIRFVLAACLGICWLLGFAQDLNPELMRGKQIYLSGTSVGKTPITATLGEDREPIPASTFPCVNCHTPNGRGKAEGGIVPSDITWAVLTKPYDLTSSTGRKRGPYTEHSLKRAITMGFDSSGNALGAAMPHFQMSQSDLADLIAYLKTLGTNTDPGLSENQIRIGVILPPARLAEMRNAVDIVIRAYFEELNQQGGIFQRRIELRTIDYPEATDQRADKILDFLATQDVFALTSSFIAGSEDKLAPIFEQKKTPLIAAFTLDPPHSASPNPFVFYFNEGVSGEARALAAFAAKRSQAAGARMAIVYFENKLSRQFADTVEQSCKASGLSTPFRIALSAENDMTSAVSHRIIQAGYDFVFLLAPAPEILSSLQQAVGENSQTTFLIPGSLAQSEIVNSPLAQRGRIFVAVSAAQRGISGNAAEEYRRLAELHKLPAYRFSEQWAALAGAKILVEGLKRSGRNLDREALIKSLEELSNFDTGFAPSLSYGPNRRAGNERVQIMEVDFKNRTLVPADKEKP